MKGEELQVLDGALLQDAFYCSVPHLKLEASLTLPALLPATHLKLEALLSL
jgi:hypothetical protein